jgi:hypothetical protein
VYGIDLGVLENEDFYNLRSRDKSISPMLQQKQSRNKSDREKMTGHKCEICKKVTFKII